MSTIETEGETITIGTTTIELRHSIKEALATEGVVIVLLDVPTGTVDNRNVIGFDMDGTRLWEIDPISDDPAADQPYVSLYEADGGIWVSNPIGAKCRLDVQTGDFVETETKRW